MEHPLLPWQHYCRGVLVKILTKIRRKLQIFFAEIIVNCQSQLIFVINLSILPPILNFSKIEKV